MINPGPLRDYARSRAVPPPAQEAMSARAATVHRLPASHSPFLSRPGEVTEVVLQALGR